MGDGKHEDQEEEEEEALSLCDLPINTCEQTNSEEFRRHDDDEDGQQSSEPPQPFEFFSDLISTEMCLAEDIILRGKIVPLKDQQKLAAFRRRSESLPQLEATRSNSTKTSLKRYSHSLDYSKLHRSSISGPVIERTSSEKSNNGKNNISARTSKSPKSWWYLLMFGLMKFPPEMELRDIKNRKVRRSPSTGGKGSWRLFKVLSCKDHESIAVTTSLSRM